MGGYNENKTSGFLPDEDQLQNIQQGPGKKGFTNIHFSEIKAKFGPCFRKFKLLIKWIIIVFFASSWLVVILYSFIPPPVTPLMIIRVFEQKSDHEKAKIDKHWVPIEKISQNMIDAVVASEDNRFLDHFGIDRQAIQEAIQNNRQSNRIRGASTISQQVAKNLFLCPSRTYIRKGFELYFTFLIELVWSKKRIMEVYLNIIETGNGIYGVETAAQTYFHKPASQLTKREAALIAISLPNPRMRNPAAPSAYMIRRENAILNLMQKIGNIKF